MAGTRTLARQDFNTPLSMLDSLSALLRAASLQGIAHMDLNLDTDIRTMRLVENTLTDGSMVFNIELE